MARTVTDPATGQRPLVTAGYAKTDLLILDDWGLAPFTAAQRRNMLELLDDLYGHRSTLVTSQMPVDKWHELIGSRPWPTRSSTG